MAKRGQTVVESPVKRWLEFKTIYDKNENATDGSLTYWDKDAEKRVYLDLPYSFAILDDEKVCFKGYNESSKEGVWSNEVYDKNHIVTIRSKSGVLLEFKLGDYKANKAKVEELGAKWTKVLYVAAPNENDEFDIIGITLSGSGLTGGIGQDDVISDEEKSFGFFNFTKMIGKNKMMNNFLTIKEAVVRKKGKTKFFVPNFELGQEISEELNEDLTNLQKSLEEYFKFYYSKKTEPTESIA